MRFKALRGYRGKAVKEGGIVIEEIWVEEEKLGRRQLEDAPSIKKPKQKVGSEFMEHGRTYSHRCPRLPREVRGGRKLREEFVAGCRMAVCMIQTATERCGGYGDRSITTKY